MDESFSNSSLSLLGVVRLRVFLGVLEKDMELSEFRRRYDDSQKRFHNSLQAITTAIEILAANNSQNLWTINQSIQTINQYVPRMLMDYEELTALVDEFCNSQQTRNQPPL